VDQVRNRDIGKETCSGRTLIARDGLLAFQEPPKGNTPQERKDLTETGLRLTEASPHITWKEARTFIQDSPVTRKRRRVIQISSDTSDNED
jgi:hypothetical protein